MAFERTKREKESKGNSVLSGRIASSKNWQMSGTFSDCGNLNLCEIYGLLFFFVEFKQFQIYAFSLMIYLNSCKIHVNV